MTANIPTPAEITYTVQTRAEIEYTMQVIRNGKVVQELSWQSPELTEKKEAVDHDS